MFGPVESLLEHDLLLVEGYALTRAVAPPPVLDVVCTKLQPAAAIPPVHRQLSLFAQLVAAIVDGEYELDEERAAAPRHALSLRPGAGWEAA